MFIAVFGSIAVLTLIAGMYGFFVYDQKVVGRLLSVFGVLLVTARYARLCHAVGLIPGGFLMEVALLAAAKWLPQDADLLVFKM